MAMHVILRATAGALKSQEFVFTGQVQVMVGRCRDCSLRLDDDTVSRRHCLVGIDAKGAWVQDLESLNGTFVNGQVVGQRLPLDEEGPPAPRLVRRLADGDELRVGSHAFQVGLVAVDWPEDQPGEEALSHQADRERCEA